MGRPINNKFIGNTSTAGQQIQATAYFEGDSRTRTAYIVKQLATNTYLMSNVGGVQSGRVQLVQGGVALQPGQANISVLPYPLSSNVTVYAETIRNRSVTTFSGSSYVWVDSATVPVDGQARLRTA